MQLGEGVEGRRGCKQNKIPVRDVRVVRIGMIKGKESPAIGRRVIKTSRYPLAPDEDVRRLTRTMNTRFTSGEKIAVGEDGGRCARGRTVWGRGRDQEDHESRGRDGQQSACNPRVPKAQNKLLGASCLACSIFGAGTTIPGAKSCGSVGKLGDRADPEGATASNGDVLEVRGTEQTRRGEAGGQGEERTREGGGKRRGNTR